MSTPAGLIIALFMLWEVALAQHSHSPHAGQEQRYIKTLSEAEIQALLNGEGMGLARAAELNHFPGPRHVLELATPLQLSDPQRTATQQIYARMHAEAVRLGQLIIAHEQALDRLFANGESASSRLPEMIREIARLQGELRLAHLQAHVDMKALLTPEQIVTYDTLRGYAAHGQLAEPALPHDGRH